MLGVLECRKPVWPDWLQPLREKATLTGVYALALTTRLSIRVR
jgi:hypothetical protein